MPSVIGYAEELGLTGGGSPVVGPGQLVAPPGQVMPGERPDGLVRRFAGPDPVAPPPQLGVVDDSGFLTPPGGGAPQAGGGLRSMTAEQVEAAMRSLEAEYQLTREQLLQEQSVLGSTYRALDAQLRQATTEGLRQVGSDALQRGVYRSGIRQRSEGQVLRQSTEQQAALQNEQSQRLAAIQEELARLRALFVQERGNVAEGIVGAGLRAEEQLALE